jgi:hypothetical protein
MEIRPIGAELFRTDTTKLLVAFLSYANAPKRLARTITFASCMLSLTIVYFFRNLQSLAFHKHQQQKERILFWMQFLNENWIQFTDDIATTPVSVLTAKITIIEELPLLDRGLFFFRTEGLGYLFDLSSIGYHYVNICKLKCNWKHYFVRMSKPTVCCVASLFSLCAFSSPCKTTPATLPGRQISDPWRSCCC